MDTFVPAAATVAMVITVINFIKFLRNGDWNGVITQLAVWVAGVVVIMFAAQTQWAAEIGSALFGTSLAMMDLWSQFFIGLCVGGLATVTNEFKKALDSGDSAKKPPMLP